MPEVLAQEEIDEMPIKIKEHLQQRSEDLLCNHAAEAAARLGTQYDHDLYGSVVQRLALDGMLKRVISEPFRVGALFLGNQSAARWAIGRLKNVLRPSTGTVMAAHGQ